jgi:hypothetical protein
MNITNITMTGIGDLISIVNQETYGAIGIFTIASLIMVGFIYLNRKYNMAVSMFLSLALALPFLIIEFLIGLVGSEIIYLYFLLLASSAVFAYMKKGE